MIDKIYLTNQVQKLIDCANSKKSSLNIIMIATSKDIPSNSGDYKFHSVTTSYLSRQELEELISSFRNYCTYLKVYTDIEEFLSDYYKKELPVQPSVIFETSAKGIGRGKDALIPTLCDVINLPHLGSEATSNIVCSSKYQWTSVLRDNAISVPDSYLYNRGKWISSVPLDEKYILKLNYECASIGLSSDSLMINDGKNLTLKASQLQRCYSQPIIAQKFIEGYEVEVPILVNNLFSIALPPVGLAKGEQLYYTHEFFDYDSIYFDDYILYDFSEIMPSVAGNLQNCAQKIIDILDLSGYMRIDFRVGADGNFYVFDINNDPSINSCGSFQKSLEILGFDPSIIAGVLIGNRLI